MDDQNLENILAPWIYNTYQKLVLAPGTFWKYQCFIATFWSKCVLCYFCKSLGFSKKDLTEVKSLSDQQSHGGNQYGQNIIQLLRKFPRMCIHIYVYLYHTHKWILFWICKDIKANNYNLNFYKCFFVCLSLQGAFAFGHSINLRSK